MNLIKVVVIFMTAAGVSACAKSNELQTCVDRGVAYYKEIGSYPTLQSSLYLGRKAEDVAEEKCSRSLNAF